MCIYRAFLQLERIARQKICASTENQRSTRYTGCVFVSANLRHKDNSHLNGSKCQCDIKIRQLLSSQYNAFG